MAEAEAAAKTTTAVKEQPKRRLGNAFGYLRLLISADPTAFDVLLLVTGILFALTAGVPYPLLAIVFGELVDELNSASCAYADYAYSAPQSVNNKVLLTVYITIASFFSIYISNGAWSLFGERLVRRLRAKYLRTLLKQEVSYFETLPPGEVNERLDSDLHVIQAGVCEKAGIVIQSVSYFVTAYVVALIKDAQLAGMLFSLVPAYLLMVFGGNYFTKKYSSRLEEKSAAANSIASEALSNMKLIKAFGASKRIETIFAGHLSGTTPAAVGKIVTAATQMGLLYFIAYGSSALAISQGGRQIAESIEGTGTITVGTVYALMLTLVDASYILCNVAPFLQLFAAAARSADKLFATMHRQSEIDGSHNAAGEKLASVEGRIEFRDVSFRYPSRKEVLVLNSLNLNIPSGKTTGIVGLSGSGKSTVASLAERLYDPEAGQVLIDGQDARSLHARHLRGHMAIVEQNPVLLDRSILENIAHGLVGSSRPEHLPLEATLTDGSLHDLAEAVRNGGDIDQIASSKSPAVAKILAMVRESAVQSSASIFIKSMPHGLATLVGPGGGQLSGGQKQRVALARALVRNPAVLILDEATAALDSTTEAQIQNALETLPGSRTVICVAHRLSTVKNADNIVVMESGGKVVEQGTYDQLMALDGVFASMVRLQTIDVSSQDATPRASSAAEASGDIEKVKSAGITPGPQDSTAVVEVTDQSEAGGKSNDVEVLKRSFLSTFLIIIKLARRQLLYIVFGVLAAVIIGGAHSGEAVIFGNAVSSLNTCRTGAQVRQSASLYGLLFFILAIVEFIANVISSASFGWISDKLVRRIRGMVLHTLLRYDLHWHESDGRTPGTLMSYLSADATAMSGLTGVVLGVTFAVLVTLVAGIVLSHIIAWKIAVVILACVPLVFASGVLRLRLQAQFAERHAKAFANSVGIATEAVNNIRTVSAYSLQDETFNSFSRSLREPYVATLNNIAWGNLCLASAFSIGPLTKALAYWWAAQLTARKELNQTQFFIVLISLLAAAQTCGQLFSLSPDISGAAVAARRVLALIIPGSSKVPKNGPGSEKQAQIIAPSDEKPDDVEKSAGGSSQAVTEKPKTGMSITFKNISFTYPTRPNFRVLDDVSFQIPAGSFVAFVGASGAGKSTIMSLLERFYLPTSGTISLDNNPLPTQYHGGQEESSGDDYPPMLDSIALVPQDPVLFSGTLAFNLSLGAPPSAPFPPQAALERAARLANVHDTIASLPQGYETAVGPQGSQSLSGGQKQRICIARALVREPRLLLLDEPTSALDAESEKAWDEALEKIRRETNVTVVAIAHRLRTVVRADRIFVMEAGRVVAQGTHAELVEGSEIYRRDVMLQTLG